jgi:ubiquitin-protein ligase
VADTREKINTYKVFTGKSEGKRQFGRNSPRLQDNIKMYLQAIGGEGQVCIDLVQDREKWRPL